MAIDKVTIQSPPNTLFSGITTDFKNNLTYAEFLLGILKKLNEMIDQVNANAEFIEKYEGKIEEIEAEITKIWAYFDTQKATIDSETDAKISALRQEFSNELYNARTAIIAYVDLHDAELDQKINDIILGSIDVYDPTTGMLSPLQTVLYNIYGASRENALTASEYDGLELTASAYDGREITAFEYDNNGKVILMA